MGSLFEEDDDLMNEMGCAHEKIEIEVLDNLDKKRLEKKDFRRLIEERLEEKRLQAELQYFEYADCEEDF